MKKDRPRPLTSEELPKMREACRLAARTLEYIAPFVKPGVSTNELDRLVYDYTLSQGALPAPLGYHGYPKSICTSVNYVVCHGVPDESVLQAGDIVNVDVTCVKDGFFGDTSRTFFVGDVSADVKDLVQAAQEAMFRGIEEVRAGATTGDIGFAIDKFVTRRGYSTVKEIGGHGIGKVFHMDPFVPSFGKKGKGEVLVSGTCLTVEPMINQGGPEILEFDIPGSTIKYYHTKDGQLSAQFEHTVLVTDKSFEILTLP